MNTDIYIKQVMYNLVKGYSYWLVRWNNKDGNGVEDTFSSFEGAVVTVQELLKQ